MVISFVLLLVGFFLLIKGAGWLVVGASALAKRYSISDLAIGLTIVAFGTSAPELVVNVTAAFQNHHEVVLSNIIGSNIFNLLAILGIAGLITPLVIQSSTVWKEIPISLIATIVLFVMANDFLSPNPPIVSRLEGVFLLLLFSLFLFYVFKQLKRNHTIDEIRTKDLSALKITILIVIGLATLIIGGRLIVTHAVRIAYIFEISEKIIGLTIVSIGTSLPELATSVVAAIKKNNDIAVGNIVGSNIFNIFLILGVSAVISPIPYTISYNLDFFVLALGTLILFLAMFSGKTKKLDRWEAGVLTASYLGYVIYLVMQV